MTKYHQVTKNNYPRLHEAFDIISHDCGAGAGHYSYSVPLLYVDRLPAVEISLESLSEEQLQMFCIGDQDEEDKMVLARPELADANALLQYFFDDWEDAE